MADASVAHDLRRIVREFSAAKANDSALGPLKLLPGTWSNEQNTRGRGWNIIALPFATPAGTGFNYRVLMNQYNEKLKFTEVDKGVPNRGIGGNGYGTTEADQFVVTLDYEQTISQIAAADFPKSNLAGKIGLPIHHEPGLWLHMINEQTDQLDIARLATVPHGDSLLALGKSSVNKGPPTIPDNVNALPIGVGPDMDSNPYLAPYKHFVDNPFKGELAGNRGFPGFVPTDVTSLLSLANGDGSNIRRTTTLEVDTAIQTGGIVNIPFITRQANAVSMKSIFWIQELASANEGDSPALRLQYFQVVMLEFFERRDDEPGLIRWPHVSINTMEKMPAPAEDDDQYGRGGGIIGGGNPPLR